MKNVGNHLSLKIHHPFGLLLIETVSPRTLKMVQSGHTSAAADDGSIIIGIKNYKHWAVEVKLFLTIPYIWPKF